MDQSGFVNSGSRLHFAGATANKFDDTNVSKYYINKSTINCGSTKMLIIPKSNKFKKSLLGNRINSKSANVHKQLYKTNDIHSITTSNRDHKLKLNNIYINRTPLSAEERRIIFPRRRSLTVLSDIYAAKNKLLIEEEKKVHKLKKVLFDDYLPETLQNIPKVPKYKLRNPPSAGVFHRLYIDSKRTIGSSGSSKNTKPKSLINIQQDKYRGRPDSTNYRKLINSDNIKSIMEAKTNKQSLSFQNKDSTNKNKQSGNISGDKSYYLRKSIKSIGDNVYNTNGVHLKLSSNILKASVTTSKYSKSQNQDINMDFIKKHRNIKTSKSINSSKTNRTKVPNSNARSTSNINDILFYNDKPVRNNYSKSYNNPINDIFHHDVNPSSPFFSQNIGFDDLDNSNVIFKSDIIDE